jgi:rubrerythrin
MTLRTFGALVSKAVQLENSLAAFYEEAAPTVRDEALKALLGELGRQARASARRLERVRREQVNEMLLEPIQGLDAADYPLISGAAPESSDNALLARAIEAESVVEQYCRDAAQQMPVPEARRSLSRTAEAHAERSSLLRRSAGQDAG